MDDDRGLRVKPYASLRQFAQSGTRKVSGETCGCVQPSLTSFACRSMAELMARSGGWTGRLRDAVVKLGGLRST